MKKLTKELEELESEWLKASEDLFVAMEEAGYTDDQVQEVMTRLIKSRDEKFAEVRSSGST